MLEWTAPADAIYLFNTFDSDFDTVLALRRDGCTGPEIECNDNAFGSVRMDTPLSAQSAIRRGMVVGEAVTLVLDSSSMDGGAAVLDSMTIGTSCPDDDLISAFGCPVADG